MMTVPPPGDSPQFQPPTPPQDPQPQVSAPQVPSSAPPQVPPAPLPPTAGLESVDQPVAPPPPVQRRSSGWFAKTAGVMALAVGSGFAGGYVAQNQKVAPVTIPIASEQGGSGAGGAKSRPEGSVARLAADVVPSVVSIKTATRQGGGTGSGLVIREEGYVLTNNHVIAGAATTGGVKVFFSDGTSAAAKIVGRSVSYDLAVLKVDRTGLKALQFGDSSQVVVGDPVIAIGAPLGLVGTVTTGIVSALNRPVSAGEGSDSAFINAIQTDAAINPGNSGGPLIDKSGRVVGINSAIARIPGSARDSSGSIGLGFSIPGNQAARTATQIINTGKATYPIVGVLLDPYYKGEGVRINASPARGQQPVSPGSPADLAGIKPGDIVTHYQGRPIDNNDELIVAIRAQKVGDEVELTVRSPEGDRTVKLTLNDSREDS